MAEETKRRLYWTMVASSYIRPFSWQTMRDGKNVYTSSIESVVSIACDVEGGKAPPVLIDFIADQVMVPLQKHEYQKHFSDAMACLPRDRARAVILFCFCTWGSRRHFIYPNRLEYKVPSELQAWLREIKQGEPMWTWLRCFLLGASGVAAMVGANEKWESYEPDPKQRLTPQRLLTNCLGRTEPKPFNARTLIACAHGHAFEDLGRQIYCHLTGNRVVEIGTAISPTNSCFSHSPDGLVVDTDGKTIGIIEIKCQEIKETCYDTCPDGYIPQCFQGMHVHGAPWCDFVSISYLPERKHPGFVTFTLERIHYEESVMAWLLRCFDAFSASLAQRSSELSMEFYKAFEERMMPDGRHQFSKIQRSYISVWSDEGLRTPAASLQMRLENALGSAPMAEFWKGVRPKK